MLRKLQGGRLRIALAAAASMAVAGMVGMLSGLLAFVSFQPVEKALKTGFNTAAVVFWVLFVVEVLIEMVSSRRATAD